MRRPIKNYDFLLLDTWEYCFTRFWPIMLTGLICSIPLGAATVHFIESRPAYEDFQSFLLESTGIGTQQAVFLTLLMFYALILYLLYVWVGGHMRRKQSAFLTVFHDSEQDFIRMEQGKMVLSEAIVLEYFEYYAVLRAKKLIDRNKVKIACLTGDDEGQK